MLKSILNKHTFIYIEDLLLEKLIGYERKLSFSFEIDEYWYEIMLKGSEIRHCIKKDMFQIMMF